MGAMKDESNEDALLKNSEVYQAPRLASVHYDDQIIRKEEKEERMMKRQRDRMSKSELLQALKSEFTDLPEEDDFDGGGKGHSISNKAQRLAEREVEKIK